MSPWWLRPTAEGANDEELSEKKPASLADAAEPAALPALAADPAPQIATSQAALHAPPDADRAEQAERADDAEMRESAPASVTPMPAQPAPTLAYTPPAPRPWPVPFEPEPAAATDGPDGPGMAALEAEAEDDEVPAEAAAGATAEESPAEKRRRSRRGRGGRRRSRSTEPEGRAEEDEAEDEAVQEEPAPAPVRMAPAGSFGASGSVTTLEARRRETGRPGESFSFSDVEPLAREIVVTIPERPRTAADERKIALFCDLENIALGVRDSDVAKFEIGLVLERLLEKGKIIVKKAYADWERYSEYKRPFHEAAIELIDIPQKYYSGKNSADIKMVVDAMDLSYSKEHLDTFVLLSGDSDFSPLVSKLKENNKYVIGIGVKNSSSNLLVDNCDEFIYYEDVWRDAGKAPQLAGLTKKQSEVFGLMAESIQALVRENKDVLWGSMIKQTMQRKKPSFNEGYYGYSTFSELLEDAERRGIVKLKKDQRSGTYIVTGFAKR